MGLLREFDTCLDYVFDDSSFKDIPYNDDGFSSKGSKLTNYLLSVEAVVIYNLMLHLARNGFIDMVDNRFDCGYAYDGLLVNKSKDLPAMERCANDFARNLGLKYLILRCKPIDTVTQLDVLTLSEQQQRVPRLVDPPEKLLLKYPTGYGKTYQSLNYALSRYRKVLIIVHRRTLAIDIKKNYPQFECYIDGDGTGSTTSADLQIICINSLHKLRSPDKYECTIADEISSLLRQIVDMKTDKIIFDMFHVFMRKPGHQFIGMDALLCDQDEQFLKSIAPFEVMRPAVSNVPKRRCIIYKDKNAMKAEICEHLLQGKRICIAYSQGIAKMDGFCKAFGIPYINVNRNTRDEHEVADWTQYQLVVYSPTMDAGVDVRFVDEFGDNRAHFDIVYGIFKRNITPKQAVQMCTRVRDCVDFRVTLSGGYSEQVYASELDFKEFIQRRLDMIKKYNLDVHLNNDFVAELVDDFHYQCVWNSIKHRRENTFEMFETYLRYYLVQNQMDLYTDENVLTDREKIEDVKEAEKSGVLADRLSLAKAMIISPTAHERLSEETQDLSFVEKQQMFAYTLNEVFGLHMDRPPAPINPGSAFDDLHIVAHREYMDAIQQKQLYDLYPFDEYGSVCRFDYVTEFKSTASAFFRFKQLVSNSESSNLFSFHYSSMAFNEVTHVIRKALQLIGFSQLNELVMKSNTRRVSNNTYINSLFGKDQFGDYLLKHTGLKMVSRPGDKYGLVSMIASADHNDKTAYYLPDSPVPYLVTVMDGFTIIGRQYRCNSCFILLPRKQESQQHICRQLKEGFEHCLHRGQRSARCVACKKIVARNKFRHACTDINRNKRRRV
jgi:hypothetical protein